MSKVKINEERMFGVIKTLVALLIALGITFVVLCLTAEDPLSSFIIMLTGPLTKLRYFSNVLETMTPLVFTALACAVLFRAGIFNLGVEGIFFICGLVTTYVATKISIDNNILHPFVAIALSGIMGGLLMLIPGWLKAKFDTNIVVSTLMLNSIYLGIGLYILKERLIASDISTTASELFMESSKLPYLFSGTRLTVGFFLALVAAVLVYIMMNKTRLGYKIRISGQNAEFAKYSGIAAFSLILLIHFISGFLAGIGSSVELLSFYDRFTWTKISTHGSTGMLIAMMGNNRVVPVMIAAFGISYLKIGAEIMSRSTVVPVEITSIVEATLVLLISSQYFLRHIREKRLLKEGIANG